MPARLAWGDHVLSVVPRIGEQMMGQGRASARTVDAWPVSVESVKRPTVRLGGATGAPIATKCGQ